MALEIITYPQTTNADGHTCKFSTGYNPMFFEISRKDFTISASGSNAGFLVLYINDVSTFAIGDTVFYYGKDVGGNLIQTGSAKIFDIGANNISILALATSPTNVIVDGWVNATSTTKREIELSGVGFTSRRFSYNSSGVVKVYLNAAMEEMFSERYTIDESNIAIVEDATIEIDVQFEDVDSGDLAETSGQYYAVKSVKQLGTDNRMVEFEVYSSTTVNSTARYLTAFTKPVMFRGYPFHLYALMGRNDGGVYNRINDHIDIDTVIPNIKGVYSIPITVTSTTRVFTSKIITNVAEYIQYLDIDEADHQLEIDGDGNTLRIQ